MKIIQTLYTSDSDNFFKSNCGWHSPIYNLLSWTLSCLQLKALYGAPEIYCNKSVRKAIDIVKLPYEVVHTQLEQIILPDSKLWALPKIYTYSYQKEPFIHIDCDVFLFKQFPNELLASDLIAQNEEVATEYYISTQEELKQHFTYFPKCVKEDFNKKEPIRAVNAGILGGCDIDFFQRYTKEAFKYIEKNIENLGAINVDRFNVFFEQHLFYSLAKKLKKDIQYLFQDIVNDNQYQHLGEFHEVPCSKSYLHLLGHYKRDEETCIKMAAKLQELYPSNYEHVIRYCHDNGMYYPYRKLYTYYFTKKASLSNLANTAKDAYQAASNIKIECVENSFRIENIKCLAVLETLFDEENLSIFDTLNIEDVKTDFSFFRNNLLNQLSKNHTTSEYLYGRDLFSQKWYSQLFNSADLKEKIICKNKDIFITETKYDWGAVYNKLYRVGINYYELLKVEKGHYYTLVVQEASDDYISMYDIDEMEKIILDFISEPRMVKEVLKELEQYVEEEVLSEYYPQYEQMIFSFIKQLVVKKAIAPYPVNHENQISLL